MKRDAFGMTADERRQAMKATADRITADREELVRLRARVAALEGALRHYRHRCSKCQGVGTPYLCPECKRAEEVLGDE